MACFITNKGRGGGCNPPNCGRGHGANWRPPVTTTSIHISSVESAIPAVQEGQGSLPSVPEFVIPTNAEASIPLSREPTPEYPPVAESTQPADLRPFLQKSNREKGQEVNWILPNIRPVLEQHWNSTDFKNKNVIAKTNQAVDKGASTYCGGSISSIVHYEKLVTLNINPSN
ncbi:hypothetical protein VNO78_12501 [Psophocarpus tetragonolobus]|uniref:Uncharacterized protein n=1 Tax=Psophocarpus tetragonolobus TaxID=3891 RepID=A0AAN9SN44_PSOTE